MAVGHIYIAGYKVAGSVAPQCYERTRDLGILGSIATRL
jgi:hypothetical protein